MPITLNEITRIRENFSLVTGKLLEHYFNFDKEPCLNFQAGLVALKIKLDRDFNAFGVKSEDDLESKLSEQNITEDELANARGMVDAEDKSGVLNGVPPIGIIAVTLGYIDAINKDLAMALQAAVRTLGATEAASYGTQRADRDTINSLIYDLQKEPNSGQEGVTPAFAREFIKFAPQYLQKAQALNHMADILCALVNNLDCDANGMFIAMEAFAVDMLNDALVICIDLEDDASPKLHRDLINLSEALNTKIQRAYQIEIEGEGVKECLLEDIRHSIDMVIEQAHNKGEAIEFANVDDIRTLLIARFELVKGKLRVLSHDSLRQT